MRNRKDAVRAQFCDSLARGQARRDHRRLDRGCASRGAQVDKLGPGTGSDNLGGTNRRDREKRDIKLGKRGRAFQARDQQLFVAHHDRFGGALGGGEQPQTAGSEAARRDQIEQLIADRAGGADNRHSRLAGFAH
jgi:hypothetical protein